MRHGLGVVQILQYRRVYRTQPEVTGLRAEALNRFPEREGASREDSPGTVVVEEQLQASIIIVVANLAKAKSTAST